MFRYCLSAMALKFFSLSPTTKKTYRLIANSIGSKKRGKGLMPGYYLERVNRMLRIANKHGAPKDGDKIIEIGTGWLHWEAITTRLFFNISGVLFDVWDNRQIDGIKNYIKQLDNLLNKINADYSQKKYAHELISKILKTDDLEHIYELLGFEYIIHPKGSLSGLENKSFDLVVSAGVLEHIHTKDAPNLIAGMASLIKPGGFSVHSINIKDHLQQYDKKVSEKQYLKYPNWIWNLCFENDLQYINKMQRSEWLDLFKSNGLDLIEEEVQMGDLSNLRLAKTYRKFDKKDIACTGIKFVHRKPY